MTIAVTKIKIFFAHWLYKLVKLFFRQDQRQINRKGINYSIDLREGLDLSLFLFGNFQSHVSDNSLLHVDNDATIYDVGANFGLMSLKYADRLGDNGKVYAFEPTDYAFAKLERNLELNPVLAKKILLQKTFLSDHSQINYQEKVYSSWRIDSIKDADNRHPVHMGKEQPSQGIGTTTLDSFSQENQVKNLQLIKIDTDGHEHKILAGAKETIKKYRPKIIFEIGLYIMEEKGISFQFYHDFFSYFNYQLINAQNNKKITQSNYKRQIPSQGTTDIIALPI